MSVASRVVLQMDQAASQYQGFLWHIRECREELSLDRNLSLSTCGHREKAFEHRAEPLHYSTDFERHPVRENPVITGPLGRKLPKHGYQ